jgi:predicted outer membrane repeat protein
MAGATGLTVEAWLRPAAGSDDWPAANPWTARVTCSGDCECTPSSGTCSGSFSDGPGDYANRQTCKWLIESPGLISLSFPFFETFDPVTVNRCTSAACDTVERLAKLEGLSDCSYSRSCMCRLSDPPVSASTVYTSSTGFLQVVFSSNGDGCNAPGFVALWNVTSAGQEGAVGFVVVGPTLAVGVLKHRDKLSVLAFRAGPAPVSQCGAKTRLTSSSGVIGDGPNYEPRSESEGSSVCEWIIAPEGARRVTLVFTELSLTGRASTFVQVYRCNTGDCSSRDPLLTVRDIYMPPPVTSDSGVMQVVFQTQYDTRPASPGFTATYAANFEAATLSVGSWQHVAVTVAPDGQRQIFVNGNLSRTDKWPDYGTVAVSRVFDRGGAIGRRSPAWQDKWWNTTANLGDDEGFFFGTVDELRVWKTVRTGASLMNQLSSNCSKLLQSETGLVSCLGFDQVADDGSSFVDEAAPDGDLGVQARPHSGETPHLPWCQGVDDGGKAPLSSTGAPVNGDQLWGFCSVDKPRLPGAGYDYDLSSMTLTASTAAAAESARMLRLHPGCGDVPLIFTGNQASSNGGAVYYDSCPAEGVDCFLQLSTERAAIFERNRVERAGGSVFVDCAVLGSKCTQSFSPQNKLGVLPLPRAEFKDNNAGKYGTNVAVAYPPCVADKYRLPGAPTCSD